MKHIIAIITNAGTDKEKRREIIIEPDPVIPVDQQVNKISVEEDISKPVESLVKKSIKSPPGLATILCFALNMGLGKLKDIPVSRLSYRDEKGQEKVSIIIKFK